MTNKKESGGDGGFWEDEKVAHLDRCVPLVPSVLFVPCQTQNPSRIGATL